MNSSIAYEETDTMSQAGGISLILRPAGPAGEVLEHALRAIGLSVRVAPTVFDIVTEAQRAQGGLQHLFVGVDHWGPAEFRLLPLVRREWPATIVVAYCSPGFAYKGRVAELVGADAVLGNIDEVMQFVESLAAPVEPEPVSEPAPQPQVPPSPAEAKAQAGAPAETSPPVAAAAPSAAAKPAAEPAVAAPPAAAAPPEPPPPAPDATKPPASPVQSIPLLRPQYAESEADDAAGGDDFDGEVIGTIELTDEELRLLLGEDEEA